MKVGELKSVVQTDSGALYTVVYANEYISTERDPNWVAPKISKFKRWRKDKAMSFWYKAHRMADERGACDGRCY